MMLGTAATLYAAMHVAAQEAEYQRICGLAIDAGIDHPTRDEWFGPPIQPIQKSKSDGDWWSLGAGVLIGGLL